MKTFLLQRIFRTKISFFKKKLFLNLTLVDQVIIKGRRVFSKNKLGGENIFLWGEDFLSGKREDFFQLKKGRSFFQSYFSQNSAWLLGKFCP